uniref:Alternative protein GINS3 n=1 Tax=Homo sapiens TaxID=9606 RepID=L8E887_HUMAN|nr:alternative protein GINS3 [Homo sapiens]
MNMFCTSALSLVLQIIKAIRIVSLIIFDGNTQIHVLAKKKKKKK